MYYIQFQNYIARKPTTGHIYANNGSAVFKGIEAEGTAKIVNGVALYGNATLNDATYAQSVFPCAQPRSTRPSTILQRDNFFGALLANMSAAIHAGSDGERHRAHPLFRSRVTTTRTVARYKLVLRSSTTVTQFPIEYYNLFNDQA